MAQPQALYRRWRPRQFGDVVGQDHVTRTLRNAVRLNRVAHGYLFCGPRGVAKTSTARILAKAINCLNTTTGEPCDECAMCVSIATGRSYDVIEMDAASNGLVDNVRELRQNVMTHPDQARRKVYILDEAHRMSAPAFDALLKTLEEPPEHVVFILITSEPDKIPGTIVSRCQRFDFRRLAQRGIIGRLNEICQAESISVEPAAIEMIARAATGSMRDAQSLLDQLVALGGPTIAVSDVAAVLGTAGMAATATLADHVVRRDIPGGLRLINQVVADGADPRQFCRDVTDYLRGLLMLKLGGPDEALIDSSETREQMVEIAQVAPVEHLLRAVKLFGLADAGWRGTLHFQLPLELAFVEATLDLSVLSTTAIATPAEAPVVRSAPLRPPSHVTARSISSPSTSTNDSAEPGHVARAPVRGVAKVHATSENVQSASLLAESSALVDSSIREISDPQSYLAPFADSNIESPTRTDSSTAPAAQAQGDLTDLQYMSNVGHSEVKEELRSNPAHVHGRNDVDLHAHWQALVQEFRVLSTRHRTLFPDAVRLRGVTGDRVVLEVRDKWASDQLNDRDVRMSVIDALTRVLGFVPRLDPVIARPNQWEVKAQDESTAIAEKVIREAAKFGWRGSFASRVDNKEPVE